MNVDLLVNVIQPAEALQVPPIDKILMNQDKALSQDALNNPRMQTQEFRMRCNEYT